MRGRRSRRSKERKLPCLLLASVGGCSAAGGLVASAWAYCSSAPGGIGAGASSSVLPFGNPADVADARGGQLLRPKGLRGSRVRLNSVGPGRCAGSDARKSAGKTAKSTSRGRGSQVARQAKVAPTAWAKAMAAAARDSGAVLGRKLSRRTGRRSVATAASESEEIPGGDEAEAQSAGVAAGVAAAAAAGAVAVATAGSSGEVQAEDADIDPAVLATIKEAQESGAEVSKALREAGLLPDGPSCVAAMRGLRMEGLLSEVPKLFRESFAASDTPDVDAYTELLIAQDRLGSWTASMEAYDAMRRKNVEPNLTCCNIMLRALRKGNKVKEAVKMVREMASEEGGHGAMPNVESYSQALMAARNDAEASMALLKSMEITKIKPNDWCYGSAIKAAMQEASFVDKGLKLFEEMGSNKVKASKTTMMLVLQGCVKNQRMDEAARVLEDLEDHDATLTQAHYDAMISAYERQGDWQQVVALAARMGQRGIDPHEITTNTVLTACAELGQWEAAVRLLGSLVEQSGNVDAAAYSTVIRACADAAEWEEVLRLYDELRERKEPALLGQSIMSPVIAALYQVGRVDEAIATYREASRNGCLRLWRRRRFGPGPSFLDTREMLPEVAAVAVRAKLEDLGQRQQDGVGVGVTIPLGVAASGGLGSAPKGSSTLFLSDVPVVQDLVVIVDDGTFEIGDGGALRPFDGTPSASVVNVTTELLGAEANIQASRKPFASLRIPATELERLYVKRLQKAVSDYAPGGAAAAL